MMFQNRTISRLEKNIVGIENRIAELEQKLAAMDEMLADSARITSDGFFGEYEQVKRDIQEAYREWELEHATLEEWQIKKTW